IVTITQANQLVHHVFRIVLAQEFFLGLPTVQQRRVAAIGATIGTSAPRHYRQHNLLLGSEDGGVHIAEAAVLLENVVVRKGQRGKIADLMWFGSEVLAVTQLFPLSIHGAVFSAVQE